MPSCLTVTTSWFCSDGGGVPWISTLGGTSTSSPICRIGVATMKMMSSTSTTSTRGVMLISLRTPPEPPPLNAITSSPSRSACRPDRRGNHEDDEQHEHDVDQGRDVDFAAHAARAASTECHYVFPFAICVPARSAWQP